MTRQEERDKEYKQKGFVFVTNFKITDLELIVICCRGAEAGFAIEKDAYNAEGSIIPEDFALYIQTEKGRDVVDLFWQYHSLVPKQIGILRTQDELQTQLHEQRTVIVDPISLDVKI